MWTWFLKSCLLKKLLNWANKKFKDFNIYNVALFNTKVPEILMICMIYSSWDIERGRLTLVILGHFFAFLPPPPYLKTQKIRILKKRNKLQEITSFYTCVPKTTIIWGMVPSDDFCHLKNGKNTWRYHQFTQVYHKWKWYDVWLLRYGTWQPEYLQFWAIFRPFTPLTPNNLKNQNFEKRWKNNPWRYHFTQVYDHMLYCFWDMACDRYNFYFSPPPPHPPFISMVFWGGPALVYLSNLWLALCLQYA